LRPVLKRVPAVSRAPGSTLMRMPKKRLPSGDECRGPGLPIYRMHPSTAAFGTTAWCGPLRR